MTTTVHISDITILHSYTTYTSRFFCRGYSTWYLVYTFHEYRTQRVPTSTSRVHVGTQVGSTAVSKGGHQITMVATPSPVLTSLRLCMRFFVGQCSNSPSDHCAHQRNIANGHFDFLHVCWANSSNHYRT